MKLRATLQRMLSMGPDAWFLFIRGIQLCCVLLFFAFMLLLQWGGDMPQRHALYACAIALNETAQAVLLIAILLSVCVEDLQSGSS